MIDIPLHTERGIDWNLDGSSVNIGLPFSEQAGSAQDVAPGVVAYNNNNGTSTVPLLMHNGALQINTVIENQNAPTRFDYSFDMPNGYELIESADGAYVAIDEYGDFKFAIGSPWAKDANGKDVSTRYEISNNVLTQIVDHDEADIAYPVVADPTMWHEWWGIAVKLTRAETINVANNFSPAYFSTVVCAYTGPFAPVCTAGVSLRLWTWEKPIKDAANTAGRCAQLNLPWGSGPVLWNVTNVAC